MIWRKWRKGFHTLLHWFGFFTISLDRPTTYFSIDGDTLVPNERVNAIVDVPFDITCVVEGSLNEPSVLHWGANSSIDSLNSEPPTVNEVNSNTVTLFDVSDTATLTMERHNCPSTTVYCYGHNAYDSYEETEVTLDVSGAYN